MKSRYGAVIAVAAGWALASAVIYAARSQVVGAAPDPEAVALASLNRQVLPRVREVATDAELRQVDVDPESRQATFHFASASGTQEIVAHIVFSELPPDQWEFIQVSPSPLTGAGHPRVDLDSLRVGASTILQAITGYWSGCSPRSLTLSGDHNALTWYGSCTLPDGRVAVATADGRTGAFQPADAPPARPPLTAAPSP